MKFKKGQILALKNRDANDKVYWASNHEGETFVQESIDGMYRISEDADVIWRWIAEEDLEKCIPIAVGEFINSFFGARKKYYTNKKG